MVSLETPDMVARWLQERVTGTLCTDSRKIQAGDGFIAWPGAATDGRHHVSDALARGAAACLIEQFGAEVFALEDARVATYPRLKAASGPIAAAYFDEPARKMRVMAVTGTNGKTSTAWWLAQALSGLESQYRIPCAMVGTLGIGRPPDVGAAEDHQHEVAKISSTGLTTPDPVVLQAALHELTKQGVTAVAIEASSIGIAEKRMDGTPVHTAIFTNFTQDHLDYHGTMEAYWQAKASLFQWPGLAVAVVNIDDHKGKDLANALEDSLLDVWTVSCREPARITASGVTYGELGIEFLVTEGGEQHQLKTSLIGEYNVSNVLGVMAAMRSLGIPLESVVRVCEFLTPVPGRMECLGGAGQPLLVVDYAHTPDALEKALNALREVTAKRRGQLWCVFGCGGNRDAGKRPLMGAVAERGADRVIVTSDNPRTEDPPTIIKQILSGVDSLSHVETEVNRALAIANAVAAAGAHDVVLVAGKGHEEYQDIGGVKQPFSDALHGQRALTERADSRAQLGSATR